RRSKAVWACTRSGYGGPGRYRDRVVTATGSLPRLPFRRFLVVRVEAAAALGELPQVLLLGDPLGLRLVAGSAVLRCLGAARLLGGLGGFGGLGRRGLLYRPGLLGRR